MVQGLASKKHDQVDSQDSFPYLFERLEHHKGGTIVDVFSGAGRDIAAYYQHLHGNGNFVAIDHDAQRLVDMVAKNFRSTIDEGIRFDIVDDHDAFVHVLNYPGNIAAIQGRFPDKPTGEKKIHLSADFMSCVAGIMFLHPKDLQPSLETMADMLNPGGDLFLLFSGQRDDKDDELGRSYFIHEPDHVKGILQNQALEVNHLPDQPDVLKRPFSWTVVHAYKPE